MSGHRTPMLGDRQDEDGGMRTAGEGDGGTHCRSWWRRARGGLLPQAQHWLERHGPAIIAVGALAHGVVRSCCCSSRPDCSPLRGGADQSIGTFTAWTVSTTASSRRLCGTSCVATASTMPCAVGGASDNGADV